MHCSFAHVERMVALLRCAGSSAALARACPGPCPRLLARPSRLGRGLARAAGADEDRVEGEALVLVAAPPPVLTPAPKRPGKLRLDALAMELYPQYSRTLLQSWILQGKVLVDGAPLRKAGVAVASDSEVTLTAEEPKFVCRGGFKLQAALETFGVDVTGLTCLDAGLSTGGFTDCLLQRGAARVYGVDVGYGQVHERVRTHPRVVVLERTNLRHLTTLPELVDIATLDLSFISVLKVLPAVNQLLRPGGRLLVLVKPQFEAQRGEVGRGGVVRDAEVHADVLRRVTEGALALGFQCQRTMASPLRGAKEGNLEFLALFVSTRADDHTQAPGTVGM